MGTYAGVNRSGERREWGGEWVLVAQGSRLKAQAKPWFHSKIVLEP
jgi:hypothetical protein